MGKGAPGDVLDRLEALVDELAGTDPAAWADGPALRHLARQFARLDCVFTRAAAAFDAGGEWRSHGALSAGAWVGTECRIPKGEAHRRVNLGRTLRHLPQTEAAWAEGEINLSHASRLAGLRREATAAALERDESLLVGKARQLRYEWWSRVLSYWESLADQDGTDERAEAKRNRRDVYLVASVEGMYLGRMSLDPVSGSIVANELGRIEDECFQADWAEAKARLGREPTLEDIGRSPAQRRADALVEMATRSASAGPGGRRPAPLFTVLVGYETRPEGSYAGQPRGSAPVKSGVAGTTSPGEIGEANLPVAQLAIESQRPLGVVPPTPRSARPAGRRGSPGNNVEWAGQSSGRGARGRTHRPSRRRFRPC